MWFEPNSFEFLKIIMSDDRALLWSAAQIRSCKQLLDSSD